jgi:hypothetical protein
MAERPREVTASSWFWFAAMVPTFIPMPARVLISDVPRQAIRQGAPLGILPALFMMSGVVLAAILVAEGALAAIWVLFVVKMRSGRNWARILLAVFGMMSVMWAGLNALTDDPVWLRSMEAVKVGAEVAAIALMFRPAAALYFQVDRT